MKAGAKLDQRRHAAIDADRPCRRFADPGDELQHGALARAVAANDAECYAIRDVERYSLQRLEYGVRTQTAQNAPGQQRALQRGKLLAPTVAAIDLVNIARFDRVHLHFLRQRVAQPVEDEVAYEERDDRRDGDGKQSIGLPEGTAPEEHLLVRDRQMGERIQVEQPPYARWSLGNRIDDRRREEPERQEICEKIAHVTK